MNRKQEVIELLQSELVTTALNADAIFENQFESLAERIVKLFAIPDVRKSLKCDCKHSGTCRYEVIMHDKQEECRHRE